MSIHIIFQKLNISITVLIPCFPWRSSSHALCLPLLTSGCSLSCTVLSVGLLMPPLCWTLCFPNTMSSTFVFYSLVFWSSNISREVKMFLIFVCVKMSLIFFHFIIKFFAGNNFPTTFEGFTIFW